MACICSTWGPAESSTRSCSRPFRRSAAVTVMHGCDGGRTCRTSSGATGEEPTSAVLSEPDERRAEGPMPQVTFFFDLGSPYAYLTAERLGDVLDDPVTWRPVALGGLFKM